MSEDTAEIMQLVAKERLYRVRCKNRELRECYYPDASIQTSWQKGDLDSYIGQDSAEVDHHFPIVGQTSTPIVHQNRRRAYVELPTTTYMRMVVKDVQVEIQSFRRLIFQVEKTADIWKIRSLVSINESDNLHPVIPGTTFTIEPAELAHFRPSYQFLCYVRKAAGGDISQDLLGVDRPEEVDKLYEATENWLNEAY